MSSPTTIHLLAHDGDARITADGLVRWLGFLFTEPNRGNPRLPALSNLCRVRVIVRETQAVVTFHAKLLHDPITHAPSADLSTSIMWDAGTSFNEVEIETIRTWAGAVLHHVVEKQAVLVANGSPSLAAKRTLQ